MKRITNRILSVIMALIMLMSMFTVAVYADNSQKPEFGITVSGDVAAGEVVTVLVTINNAAEMDSALVDITYNPEDIEIISIDAAQDTSECYLITDVLSDTEYRCFLLPRDTCSGDINFAVITLKVLDAANASIGLAAFQWIDYVAPDNASFNLNAAESDDELAIKLYIDYTITNGEVTIDECDSRIRGDVVIPDTIEGYPVTEIAETAFTLCNNITSLVIPDSVKTIGRHAIDCCSNLKSVTIGSGVRLLGDGIFWNDSKLETVVIKEGVTYIPRAMFEQCNRLKSVSLPDSVTSIGSNAFMCCTALEEIELPSGLQTIENAAFLSCEKLIRIDIPMSVDSIGESAFGGCKKLSVITIPDNSEIEIASSAFSDTTYVQRTKNKIKGVTYIGNHIICGSSSLLPLPECYIKEGTVTIQSSVFRNNQVFTEVTIPGSVVSVGSSAFYNCSKLNSVTICDGVQKIGDFAFYDCKALKEVTIPESVTSIGEHAFGYHYVDYSKVDGFVIYGYEGSAAETYANTNGFAFVALCKHETTVVENAADATCTADGYTGDIHCEACDELLTSGETVSKTGHTEEILPAVPATYTETGLTEGKKCSVCNEILVAQEVIPMLTNPNLTIKDESITVNENIVNLVPKMTVSSFKENVENENVAILSADGQVLADDAFVGTGAKVQIKDENGNILSEYEVLVKSDVNGDGVITPADARLALRTAARLENLDGLYKAAADYDGTDTITPADARMILRKAAGLE